MDAEQVYKFLWDFTSIVYEAMPFLILGSLISGILEEMVPQRLLARFIPRNRFLSILIGGLLGLVFPMCDCGIIPIMCRLLRKKLPLSTCTSYMLAGPIINVVVMASTYFAFLGQRTDLPLGRENHPMGPWQIMVFRMGLGYLVAIGASLVVEWQWRRHGYALLMPMAIPPAEEKTAEEEQANGPRSWWQRVDAISEAALHDFVDVTTFLVLGALLAALARQILDHEQIAQMEPTSQLWLS